MASTPAPAAPATGDPAPSGGVAARLAVAWTVVGVPLAYGIVMTVRKAAALFSG